jgi:cytochrome P460
MTKSTLEAEAILRRAPPLTHQEAHEIQPFGHLVRMPSTGGWGFGHFYEDGKPGAKTLLETCSPCHAKTTRDSVFTRYSR